MLSDDDLEHYNSLSGLDLRNLPVQDWRAIAAVLPPGSRHPFFFYGILLRRRNYPSTPEEPRKSVQTRIRERERLIKKLRSVIERMGKLQPYLVDNFSEQ